VIRLSKTTGQVRDISPAAVSFGSKYHFNWTIPMVFAPQDPHLLYLGTQFLLKTTNAGTNWQVVSPDLSRTILDPKNPKQAPGTILTIAPSPVQEGLIWVGTDDGNIQVTKDGGTKWANVTPPDLSVWSTISIVEPSHFDAGTAYAAVNRNGLDDVRPHIFRTRDFGQSWEEVVSGIGAMDFVRTVREDPARKGLLFAGTEAGVYVSLDDGDHWHSMRLNMPFVAVHDLAVEQDDLVAASYGRSFWILDDISPLRELNANFGSSAPHLLAPRATVRVRRDENQDTPLPPEVPAGQNPPDGAILHYFLPERAGSDIQVGIYDQAGTIVKMYSSASIPPEKEKEDPFIASYWIAHPEPLSREKGMHRFVWDLRYTDPPAIHVQSPYNYPIGAIVGATPLPPQGPLVMPGKYEVRLKVGEQVMRQPLEVKMDPRVSYIRHELQSSLDLQLKISAALGVNYAAYRQIKDVRARLAELKKRPKEDPVGAGAASLDGKLAGLEGEPTPLLEEPKTVSFSAVNDTLTALMALVDGADFAPSEESFAAYQRTCKALKATLDDWQAIKTRDLPSFKDVAAHNNVTALPEYPDLSAADNCEN
jgi:hypothetical protein